MLAADLVVASETSSFGLVSRLTKPGRARAEAEALAARITASAPLAVWESRAIVLAAQTKTDDELISMTNAAFARIIAAEDTKEGLAAFIEKRAPNWQAR